MGSEFLQALDVRFASQERAILGQLEVGTGLFPGGGGLERLPRMICGGRAIEVVVGADDFDADTAERYGRMNRSIPDAELPSGGIVDPGPKETLRPPRPRGRVAPVSLTRVR